MNCLSKRKFCFEERKPLVVWVELFCAFLISFSICDEFRFFGGGRFIGQKLGRLKLVDIKGKNE